MDFTTSELEQILRSSLKEKDSFGYITWGKKDTLLEFDRQESQGWFFPTNYQVFNLKVCSPIQETNTMFFGVYEHKGDIFVEQKGESLEVSMISNYSRPLSSKRLKDNFEATYTIESPQSLLQ